MNDGWKAPGLLCSHLEDAQTNTQQSLNTPVCSVWPGLEMWDCWGSSHVRTGSRSAVKPPGKKHSATSLSHYPQTPRKSPVTPTPHQHLLKDKRESRADAGGHLHLNLKWKKRDSYYKILAAFFDFSFFSANISIVVFVFKHIIKLTSNVMKFTSMSQSEMKYAKKRSWPRLDSLIS